MTNKPNKLILNAYHGTDAESAKNILSERKFQFQSRDNHWLGDGVYFFIDDKDEAEWWSIMAVRHKNRHGSSVSQGAVLFVPIICEKSCILDLDTYSDGKIFEDFIESIIDKYPNLSFTLSDGQVKQFAETNDEHILMSQWLKLFLAYKKDSWKAVMKSFPICSSKEKRNSNPFQMRAKQLNIIDQKIINFDKIIKIV
ncbi:hypothetical protein [Leuconostoc suionicum]|uniref:hypothetical protein n=1 Tax=Leuconostoc suionicum TaxID=1511761 RepID=UPI001B8C5488|nr:hypothetical protein [Leuconostoc suionicum]MBS1007802.1 hypothetical protein [Leuconostoc suionicum]